MDGLRPVSAGLPGPRNAEKTHFSFSSPSVLCKSFVLSEVKIATPFLRWSKWKLRSEDFEENQEPSCGLVQLSWIQVTQFAQNGVALLQEGILPRSLPDEVASLSELQGPYLRSALGLAAKVSGPLPHSKVPFCPLSLGIVPPSWLGFSPLL